MGMFILLDIDGVMVPAQGWKRPEILEDGFPAFSKRATHVLQELVRENTTIMLTTSHKGNYSIEEWKRIFGVRGIPVQQINTLPVNSRNLSRRMEIEEWHGGTVLQDELLILDDDPSLNELPPYLKQRVVKTCSSVGLTEEHLTIARNLLN